MLEGSMVRRALMPAARDASAADAQDDARLLRRLARGDARALEALGRWLMVRKPGSSR